MTCRAVGYSRPDGVLTSGGDKITDIYRADIGRPALDQDAAVARQIGDRAGRLESAAAVRVGQYGEGERMADLAADRQHRPRRRSVIMDGDHALRRLVPGLHQQLMGLARLEGEGP